MIDSSTSAQIEFTYPVANHGG